MTLKEIEYRAYIAQRDLVVMDKELNDLVARDKEVISKYVAAVCALMELEMSITKFRDRKNHESMARL